MHQTKFYLAYGSISFFFMFVTGLHGQSETTKSDPLKFHLVRFIEVESENVEEFKIAAQEKTKTFNSGNQTSRWWTYRISDGKRSGQFARGFGDVTAKQLDHPKFPVQGLVPETDDEAKYWIEKVAPLQKSSGNREVWQEIQGTRYRGLPAGHHPKFVLHRRWKMLPGMYQKLENQYSMFSNAIRKSGIKANWTVTRLHMGGDFMTYQESLSFDRLSDTLLGGDVWQAAFEDANGEGSWKKHLEEHAKIMQPNAEVIAELWTLQPNLGNSSFGQ